eukprot:scaffold128389_cov35-Tisochrysis_lutea.AAC.3
MRKICDLEARVSQAVGDTRKRVAALENGPASAQLLLPCTRSRMCWACRTPYTVRARARTC